MRTLLLLLLVIIMLPGCKSKNAITSSNAVQNRFTSFFDESCRGYSAKDNDVQKSDYFKQFKTALNKLVDSAGLLRNWKGKVTYLSFQDVGSDVTMLHLTFTVPIDNVHFITLDCEKNLTTSLLDSMLLYGQLKQIKVGDEVYFDGIIKRGLQKDVKFGSLESFDLLSVCNPTIQFYAVSIAKDSSAVKKSADFEKGINVTWSSLMLAADVYTHTISDSVYRQQAQVYQQQLVGLSPSFTIDDKRYLRELLTSFEAQYK